MPIASSVMPSQLPSLTPSGEGVVLTPVTVHAPPHTQRGGRKCLLNNTSLNTEHQHKSMNKISSYYPKTCFQGVQLDQKNKQKLLGNLHLEANTQVLSGLSSGQNPASARLRLACEIGETHAFYEAIRKLRDTQRQHCC